MADRPQATTVMTLERFLPAANPDGAPAVLLLRKQSTTPSGSRRPVSMKAFVRDAELSRRRREEVSEGDEIRVTTENAPGRPPGGGTLPAFEPVDPRPRPLAASGRRG